MRRSANIRDIKEARGYVGNDEPQQPVPSHAHYPPPEKGRLKDIFIGAIVGAAGVAAFTWVAIKIKKAGNTNVETNTGDEGRAAMLAAGVGVAATNPWPMMPLPMPMQAAPSYFGPPAPPQYYAPPPQPQILVLPQQAALPSAQRQPRYEDESATAEDFWEE